MSCESTYRRKTESRLEQLLAASATGRLEDKPAVVTAGTNGIGLAAATRCLAGGHTPVFPLLSRSTAAEASYLTISFLSSNAGVSKFRDAGSSLLTMASTAAARTRHFLSEQALAKAALIFGS